LKKSALLRNLTAGRVWTKAVSLLGGEGDATGADMVKTVETLVVEVVVVVGTETLVGAAVV
jgi:hypothetical protein